MLCECARAHLCVAAREFLSSVVVVRRRSSSFGSSEALVEAFSGSLIVRAGEEALSSVFCVSWLEVVFS